MSSPQKASNININKISFSGVRSLDNGGKMVFVNYDDGKFYLQTPELEVPFDARYYGEDGDNSGTSKNGKYSIKVQLKDSDESTVLFKEKLKQMDELLKQKASENSQTWFKKPKLSMDAINELYTPFVGVSRDRDTGEPDGKYPDTFGFKIHKKEHRFQDFSIYDNKKKVFNVNDDTDDKVDLLNVIVKGAQLKVVLKCNGIWIANGKFGCTWKAEQVRIKVPEEGLRDFAIESDEDDEVDEVSRNDGVVNQTPNKMMIEDSETDEEEEEEVVDEPEPEPESEPEPVKKKRVRRVKVSN